MEFQVGSKQQPIILKPKIDGKAVTVTEIKNTFSNFFVSDVATPVNFVLETRTRLGVKATLNFNAAKSTDTEIWFFPLDPFYATVEKKTALFYWTIGVEQVYTEIPIVIDVKELHNE